MNSPSLLVAILRVPGPPLLGVDGVVDEVYENLLEFERGCGNKRQVRLQIGLDDDLPEPGASIKRIDNRCDESRLSGAFSDWNRFFWAKLRSLWVISLQRSP